jgi:hypothetical protein
MVRCYLLATNSLFDRYWITILDLASKGPGYLHSRFRVALPSEDPSTPDLPLNAGDGLAGIRLVLLRAPVAQAELDDDGSGSTSSPGGKLVRFFVSETGCARALLGWSQNTLAYAAGLGRVKDA